ncbi:MAG: phospholipid carrier-dependent glycosyltransferase [Gemmatimonadales bacterium]|nr:phospholipid carrier-dependent glycosyltransferase [Gemmatimonadales bacterium]
MPEDDTSSPRTMNGLRTRPALQAGLVALVVGAVAQWISHQQHIVFAFWDAQAHLDIARRVVDSVTPGLQMLGTVWLPVPHLLLLPFTLVDAWWWNGLAGGLVGLLAFVVIGAAVHDLLVRRTGHPALAWCGTLLVLGNPSLLYLQTTAMTEPVLLAFLTASVAALDRWAEATDGRTRALGVAAWCAALAVGTRYDGWFYVMLATPVVAWLAHVRGAGWFRAAWRFGWPSALMVTAWLGYNALYFDDPLAFQRGAWSAQSQQAALAAQGLLPTKGNLLTATTTYLGAVGLTVGMLVGAAGLLALGVLLRHRHRFAGALLLYAALPFNILALVGGQSALSLPWSDPPGVANLRYGLMLLPAAAIGLTLAASRAMRRGERWRRGTLLALGVLVVAQVGLWTIGGTAQIGALREGLAIRDGDPRQQAAADWLAMHYDQGRVLVDPAINVSPRSRIALRDRIYAWTWQLGPAALAAPEDAVDWVLVDQRANPNAVAAAIKDRPPFLARFDRRFAQDGLEIWRRR